jgi:hypothetical protein
MKSLKPLWFGFLAWLVPFIVAVAIFPLKESGDPLFETIMPLIVTLSAVVLTHRHFAGFNGAFLREGVFVGVLWMAISLALDACMFAWGPMKMTFAAYLKDIGLGYLIFPAVTIGIGWLLHSRAANQCEKQPAGNLTERRITSA